MISTFQESDLAEIERIHRRFYRDEFTLAEFNDTHTLEKIVVRDKNNEIITTANIRAIAEIVAITDKSKSPRSRRAALLQIYQMALLTARKYSFDQLHVAVQDMIWEDQLLENGFRPTKGKLLVTDVG